MRSLPTLALRHVAVVGTLAGACSRSTPPLAEPRPVAAPDAGPSLVPPAAADESAPEPSRSAIVFDFEENLLMGDTGGRVLATLESYAEPLHECLRGLEHAIDDGQVSSTSARVSISNAMLRDFRIDGAPDPVNECLDAVLGDLEMPAHALSGVVSLRPREPDRDLGSTDEVRWTVRLEQMSVEMIARLPSSGDRRAVELSGSIRVQPGQRRGLPDRTPIEVIDEYTTLDGGMVHTGSWSHNETELPHCHDSAEPVAVHARLREVAPGGYVGAQLWLMTGPCEGPVHTLSLGSLRVDWTQGEQPTVRALPLWRYQLEQSPGERILEQRRARAFAGE